MNLSPHFTLEEMTASQLAVRLRLPNVPSAQAVENLKRLCETILEPLRERVGPIYINSGYRAPLVNRALGSKVTSHHVQGRAADIRVHGWSPLDLCEVIVEMNLPFEQLIHEYGSWTHVSVPMLNAAPSRVLLTIDHQGTVSGLMEVRQ